MMNRIVNIRKNCGVFRLVLYATLVTVVIVGGLLGSPGASQAAAAWIRESSGDWQYANGPTDPAELEAFLDLLMREQMEENHIAGAAVSVVSEGGIMFVRGYGLADVAASKPVNPERTLFHTGSVAKVFTFTAVMQLVEQGKIDLNEDINTYLDFEIPATYPEPITMAHLMGHAGGLDEFAYGMGVESPEEVIPLGEYVRAQLPPRVRPPGVVSAYTNYGVALAGYIVERVSGQPYGEYIQEHILDPLGMDRSSCQSVLPAALRDDLSLSYQYREGVFESVKDPLYLEHGTPASCIKSTAVDMAHFMIAHLQNGTYKDARILEEETARLMHSTHFEPDPRVNGWAHGFYEMNAENPRVIGHGGHTIYFHTQMGLVPEAGVGIFVVNNSGANDKTMINNVINAFFDHYFSITDEAPTPLAGSTTDLEALEGSYAPSNISYGTKEKPRMVMVIHQIQAQEDGSLLVSSLVGSTRYVEIEPRLFQREDGKHVDYLDRFSFITGQDGVDYMVVENISFQKLPWYESMGFILLHAGSVMLIFLSVPVAALVVRLSRRQREQSVGQSSAARWARWLLGLLVLTYFVSQAGTFSAFATEDAFLYGKATAFTLGNLLAFPVIILAAGAVVFTYIAWKRGFWTVGWRVHYTLVTVAAMSVVWWFFNWKVFW